MEDLTRKNRGISIRVISENVGVHTLGYTKIVCNGLLFFYLGQRWVSIEHCSQILLHFTRHLVRFPDIVRIEYFVVDRKPTRRFVLANIYHQQHITVDIFLWESEVEKNRVTVPNVDACRSPLNRLPRDPQPSEKLDILTL